MFILLSVQSSFSLGMEFVKITILASYFLLTFVNAQQTRRRFRVKPYPAYVQARRIKVKPYHEYVKTIQFETKHAPAYGKRSDYLQGVDFDRKHRLYPVNVLQLTSYPGYVREHKSFPGYVREHESFPGYLQGHRLGKTINFKDRPLNSDGNTNSDDLFRDGNMNLYPASEYFNPRHIPPYERNTDYHYPETEEKIPRGFRSKLFRPLSNFDKRVNGELPLERISALYNSQDKRLV